ncbi:MAG: cyclodeaminase/cyclohydrolase family protein [Gammaproteobacteria bacterium]|nr:cyclodeaminase/cyclohydrolase family protein [Gammaproteobacteria bacterium]MBU1831165.1 cyclodeaminase/cyclohydrolase family protein [Gammaproteobacteria bacterium]
MDPTGGLSKLKMPTMLIDLPIGVLLSKFGAGEHKPGSGSAAALQAMISAQLVITVLDLSLDKNRSKIYGKHHNHFKRMRESINNHLLPNLCELFQHDSDEFDRAIKLRRERDASPDLVEKRRLRNLAEQALIPAIEIPIKIAEISAEIFDYGRFNFQNGFQSARGDSGAAMGGALAAISACISIIELNLLSIKPQDGRESFCKKLIELKKKQANCALEINSCNNELASEHAEFMSLQNALEPFRKRIFVGKALNDGEIELLARRLQRIMWKFRHQIWRHNTPQKHLEILDPKKAIELIDYIYQTESSLGIHIEDGKQFETAGLIDNQKAIIHVSLNASPDTVRFTASHELGHAVLHAQSGLHRDRPLDGGDRQVKDITERQADKFSTYFLMPKLHIIPAFKNRFLTDSFSINESTAFALSAKSVEELITNCRDRYGLALELANSEFYNGKHFLSIAKEFRVSQKAMATRLIELNLIDFSSAERHLVSAT